MTNYTTARCGHQVIAEGAPGSSALKACEKRTCDRPRCKSGLPDHFTDRECAAEIWMWDKPKWMVDLDDKTVVTASGKRYANLVEFAKHHGWDG